MKVIDFVYLYSKVVYIHHILLPWYFIDFRIIFITSNLSRLSDMSKLLYTFSILMTYLIQFYVPMQIIEGAIEEMINKRIICNILRALLVSFTCKIYLIVELHLFRWIALVEACSSLCL